ncbi:MAG: XdhC family protein [Spirochaetaceae bacterium]|jgi:xanthine dehydrogenase accessory factor|uniref:Cytochrome oxidase I n=1 Tax=Sphaerochaeta halotolerans TaxID=2293840 RepID=A0A372MIN1_9SPIR|nr:XdhC/CoxI family protein [Sphaerochaeta halotolerans]MBG0766104.1 XdhC family protein [Spirochaetaceae bacterium]RFU95176.1 cytochrome oxidase I [Sphaerochaeta halotolerans]
MDSQQYYKQLLEALKIDTVERRTVLQGPYIGDEALLQHNTVIATHSRRNHDWNDPSYLTERLATDVHLVIFGGGHIALDLYHLAVDLALQVTIVDDRPDFCNQERFPKATCLCAPFEEVLGTQQSWIRPYFIITTRGHAYDRLCLKKTLRLPHAYIGMIGSKKKVANTFDALREEHYSEAELATVKAPIGLDIGAVTSSEIALSILAQVISEYRKNEQAVRLDERILAKQATGESHILVRVVEKHGSAPCEVGFQLALFADRTLMGTVGGGAIEARAIKEAQRMLMDAQMNDHVVTYDLSNEHAGNIGMICGGVATLLFQRR